VSAVVLQVEALIEGNDESLPRSTTMRWSVYSPRPSGLSGKRHFFVATFWCNPLYLQSSASNWHFPGSRYHHCVIQRCP